MGKKKFLLDDAPENSHVLGILCQAKDYKLSWEINQALGIELKRDQSIRWITKKLPAPENFNCYRDNRGAISWLLIRNLSENGIQILDYKGMDYLLVCLNTEADLLSIEKTKIRNINGVQGVFDLNVDPLLPFLV